jgi:hypothetical protein
MFMKIFLIIFLGLISEIIFAQELTKKELKIKSDSIAFGQIVKLTGEKQFTFYANEQEFLGSSSKLTRNEHFLTVSGDSIYVFLPFPNSFDPALITDTRNLDFIGQAENYLKRVNEKQKRVSINFQYKYLATVWEFILSIEKDQSSTLWIRTEQGAQIKFLGNISENE